MRSRFLLAAVVLTALGSVGVARADDPAGPRQRELLYLLVQDCGSCHGSTLKGGLGPPLLPRDLSGKPDEALVDAIIKGRPGTPMPPWGFELSEGEAAWLVQKMKQGLKK